VFCIFSYLLLVHLFNSVVDVLMDDLCLYETATQAELSCLIFYRIIKQVLLLYVTYTVSLFSICLLCVDDHRFVCN